MKMVCRIAALLAVAHANLNTGIDDSVSLLQTRAEKIHRPHQQKASTKELLSISGSKVGTEFKHSEHHAAEKHSKADDVWKGHKSQMEVSMGQVVKEKTGSEMADEFAKEDLTTNSDIAKLVDEVEMLAKDEAEVSKEVSKEMNHAKQNRASNRKQKTETIVEAETSNKKTDERKGKDEDKKKGGALGFLDEILGKPISSKDLNLSQDRENNKKTKKEHVDIAEKVEKKVEGKKEQAGDIDDHIDPVSFDAVQDKQKKPKGDGKKDEGKGKNDHIDSLSFDSVQDKQKEHEDHAKDFDLNVVQKDKDTLSFDAVQVLKEMEMDHEKDLNLNAVQKDKEAKQKGDGKVKGKGRKDDKGKKEIVNPLDFDITEPTPKKREPTLVRFQGTELAKTAVHFDEMTSAKETAKLFAENQHLKTHSDAKLYATQAEELERKLAENARDAKSNIQAEDLQHKLAENARDAKNTIHEELEHKLAEHNKDAKNNLQAREELQHKLAENAKAAKNKIHEELEHKVAENAKAAKSNLQAEELERKLAENAKAAKNSILNAKSNAAADDSLAKYHPGWKLYELEGGQQANQPQADEERDLIAEKVDQSDKTTAHQKAHHKHHENLVSEAMGAAFGDSDAAQIATKEQEVAKLYSSTASKGPDDTEEFWGEEDPSEIDREFTVEGIPMTSALGKDVETASLNKVDTHKKTKHADSMKNAGSKHKAHQKSAEVTEANKTSALTSTSRRSRRLTQEEMCEGVSTLDFSAATVTHSNLGGLGPDSGEETLVYSGITNQDGFVVDLVVTATSPYEPRDANKNGLQDDFGVINLEINSAVDLLFRFVSAGEPFVMNSFYFTFFDLDQGRAHEAREKATIRGFDSYTLSDGTSLEVEELGDSSAIFSSSMRGGKVDNPTSPLSLSHLQRERSVVVSLSGVSEFSVQLSEENYASSQGRNWFFAGPSSMVCDREAKCSTYECPDGYHTRTMAEFLVCAGSRCNTRDDRDTCCYELEEESADLYSKSARIDKTKPGRTKIKSAKYY